jgi:hypothetical protein
MASWMPLGDLGAGDTPDESESEIDPGGDSWRGQDLALVDDALLCGLGAIRTEHVVGAPVRRNPIEQAGRGEKQRSGAHPLGQSVTRRTAPAKPASMKKQHSA